MKKLATGTLLCCLFSSFSNATHLRGGEIVLKQVPGSLRVTVILRVYTNINTNALFGGEDTILDFGDGTDPDNDGKIGILVPEEIPTLKPGLGHDESLAVATYTIDHLYASSDLYIISYSEPNRNEGIVNMEQSVNTKFYLESSILLDPHGLSYESPQFLLPPVFSAKVGFPLKWSMACKDKNGLALSYVSVAPKQDQKDFVINYVFPENYSVNSSNGLVRWDAKYRTVATTGEFAFAVRVVQKDESGNTLGYIQRDFQIILEEYDGEASLHDNQKLNENGEIYLAEGISKKIKVFGNRVSSNQPGLLQISSELEDKIEFVIYDSTVSEDSVMQVGIITLRNISEIKRHNPYNIAVRFTHHNNAADLNYLFFTEEPVSVVAIDHFSQQSDDIAIFPNPFHHTFTVTYPHHEDISITVTDLEGKAIPADRKNNEFEIISAENGIYLLVIRSPNKTQVKRIVKN